MLTVVQNIFPQEVVLKLALTLLFTTVSCPALAQSTMDANAALSFLTPCLKEAAAAVNPINETLSLESGEYVAKSDFTITYTIYTSDMHGYRVNRRLLVHAKYDRNPMQDGSDLTFACEIK